MGRAEDFVTLSNSAAKGELIKWCESSNFLQKISPQNHPRSKKFLFLTFYLVLAGKARIRHVEDYEASVSVPEKYQMIKK